MWAWIAAVFLGYLVVVGIDVLRDLGAHSRRWSQARSTAQRAAEPGGLYQAHGHREKHQR